MAHTTIRISDVSSELSLPPVHPSQNCDGCLSAERGISGVRVEWHLIHALCQSHHKSRWPTNCDRDPYDALAYPDGKFLRVVNTYQLCIMCLASRVCRCSNIFQVHVSLSRRHASRECIMAQATPECATSVPPS